MNLRMYPVESYLSDHSKGRAGCQRFERPQQDSKDNTCRQAVVSYEYLRGKREQSASWVNFQDLDALARKRFSLVWSTVSARDKASRFLGINFAVRPSA